MNFSLEVPLYSDPRTNEYQGYNACLYYSYYGLENPRILSVKNEATTANGIMST